MIGAGILRFYWDSGRRTVVEPPAPAPVPGVEWPQLSGGAVGGASMTLTEWRRRHQAPAPLAAQPEASETDELKRRRRRNRSLLLLQRRGYNQ